MKKSVVGLNGLRILNTRPTGQQQSLSQTIIAAGGIAIELPALNIEPTDEHWLQQLPRLTEVHQSIFISANAVNFFFSTLKKNGIAWPNTIKTLAIGHATARALTAQSIAVNQVPDVADSEHLLALAPLQHVKGQTILLIKGIDGREDIARTLHERGAQCLALSVYRRVLPTIDTQKTADIWKENLVDIILFTSQQAMQNIFTLFGPEAYQWLCHKPCIVISQRLADIAKTLGVKTIWVSPYEDLLNTLELYIKNTAR